MSHYGGDDLDDGLVYEAVVSEGEEEDQQVQQSLKRKSMDDNDIEVEGVQKKKNKKKKQKGDTTDKQDNSENEGEGVTDGVISGKLPKRKAKQDKMLTRMLAEDAKVTGNAATQMGYVWGEFMDTVGNKLSTIELDEFRIESTHFVDVPEKFQGVNRQLSDLKNYLKAIEPHWQQQFGEKPPGKAFQKNGHPTVLIITLSGQSAADVFRELKEFNTMCRVAKLFAKHLDVAEQTAYLAKGKCRIAVGTPNRIQKLIET
eukprot:Ihof_evm2s503 gene=Ihof_evmTU2s503